jgi:glycosyltransferase involved in cell wall biosynthesis
MSARILVDVSGHFSPTGSPRNAIVRIERELARRLLDDPSLNTLPILFGPSGVIFAVDRQHALDVLNHREQRTEPQQIQAIEAVAGAASAPQYSFRRRALRSGLGMATVAGRRVISRAPEHARSDIRQSLLHARNALVAIVRAPRPQQVQELAPPPEQPEPAPVACAIKPVPAKRPALSTVVHPSRRDIVWTCGPAVESVPLRQIAEAKRASHFRLASICYDMYTVRQAAWPAPAMSGLAAARGIDQLDASDLIFCVSAPMQEDLHSFAVDNGRPSPDSRLIPLGVDLSHPETVGPATADTASPTSRRFALSVGKLDAVNNHGLLLRVWQQLVLEPQFDLDLVIAGREGDATIELMAKMREWPLLRGRVHYLGEVADSELIELYSNCQMLLCPTLDHGWVLSVGEALGHGRQVICSDHDALRAASHGQAAFLDPLDHRAWTSAIRAAAASRQTVSDLTLPTWDECAALLRKELLGLVNEEPGS